MAAPETVPVEQPAHDGGIDFDFTAGALGLFGRSLLAGIGMILIVPAPWVVCWYYEWLFSVVQGRWGSRLEFRGTPGSVWVLTTLYGVLIVANIAYGATQEQGETNVAFDIGFQLASLVLGWALWRWMVSQLELNGARLRLGASLLGYVGWMLLLYLSIITIIGWAWVTVFFYRWLAGTVDGAPGRFGFKGEGHQILWRTLAMILFMLPVLTIPWAIRWYMAWLVEQITYEETPAAVAA